MSTKRSLTDKHFRVANCDSLQPHETRVQPNLSITPHDVKALTERGIAISTQRLGMVTDTDTPSDYLPLEDKRGVDINTAWEASQNARYSVLSNYKYSKSIKNQG